MTAISIFSVSAAVGDKYEGENYSEGSGVTKEATNVGYIDSGDWIKYSAVSFDGNEQGVDINTSGKYDGVLEFRLDAVNGTLIGTVNLAKNGSWTNYHIIKGVIAKTTGTHDLYLVFSVGGYNVDYFQFTGGVKTYSFTNSCMPTAAGSILHSTPTTSVVEGDMVTFGAERNLGYKFKCWKNAKGDTLSVNNPFSMTITKDTSVIAVFDTKVETAELPKWSFDRQYALLANSGDSIYYPKMMNISAQPNAKKKVLLPDNYLSATGSKLTNNSDTVKLVTTGSSQTFRINWTDANDILDFTKGANHKQYYQFVFPTTGFKDIKVNYAFSGGQSDVMDFMELVYSVDNGANWIDAKQKFSANYWNTWVTDTTSLANAAELNKVIVRLIGVTIRTGANLNFNLDYFNVTGTANITGLKNTLSSTADIIAFKNQIKISVNKPTQVSVFNTTGSMVSTSMVKDESTINLQPGIYIVKAGADIKKLIVQ